MILRKVIIDGKELYESINYEEAFAYSNKDELVFTNDDEKEKFEEKIEMLEELTERIEELNEKVDYIKEGLDCLDEKDRWMVETRLDEIKAELERYNDLSEDELDSRLDSIEDELCEMEDKIDSFSEKDDNTKKVMVKINGKNINLGKDFSDIFGKNLGNLFGEKKKTKDADLIAALPFMDKGTLHEIVNGILNGDERYKELDLIHVIPFLDRNDCDTLFMKLVIKDDKYSNSIVAFAPFVSGECLSNLVDEYINGNYQNIEMSTLYPFLNNNDVKKIFNYILINKCNIQE